MQQLHPHTGTAKRVAYGMAVPRRLLRTNRRAGRSLRGCVRGSARAGRVAWRISRRKCSTRAWPARGWRWRCRGRRGSCACIWPRGPRCGQESALRRRLSRRPPAPDRAPIREVSCATPPSLDASRSPLYPTIRCGRRRWRGCGRGCRPIERRRRGSSGSGRRCGWRAVSRDSAVLDSVEQTWVLYGTLLARVGRRRQSRS